jgi:hypothetical protein
LEAARRNTQGGPKGEPSEAESDKTPCTAGQPSECDSPCLCTPFFLCQTTVATMPAPPRHVQHNYRFPISSLSSFYRVRSRVRRSRVAALVAQDAIPQGEQTPLAVLPRQSSRSASVVATPPARMVHHPHLSHPKWFYVSFVGPGSSEVSGVISIMLPAVSSHDSNQNAYKPNPKKNDQNLLYQRTLLPPECPLERPNA